MKRMQTETPLVHLEEYARQLPMLDASARTLDQVVSLHAHDCFEIELICAGSGMHHINGRSTPLQPGSIYLLTPADVHVVVPACTLHYYNVMFSEDFFSDDFGYEMLLSCRGTQMELTAAEQARVLPLFQQLAQESACDRDAYSVSYVRSLLQCILITLTRRNPPEMQHGTGDRSLRPALFYLQRHFREAVTLEAVARSVHISPNYFCERFKAETGCCFSVYVNALRTRYAHRLLVSGDTPITEICFSSGFRSFSSFSREFKKRYGVSPSEARQNTKVPE